MAKSKHVAKFMEAPVAEPVSAPTVKVKAEPLPNGRCSDCDLRYEACKGDHVVRNLAQKVILNGVVFGPGKCVTPRDADVFNTVTIPE